MQNKNSITRGGVPEDNIDWYSEIKTGKRYNEFMNCISDVKLMSYPREIAFEFTTYCCAKCRNCTHEELINNGGRKLAFVDFEEAKYRIKKVKLFSLLCGVKSPQVSPVGLGEPFCHPQMVEILRYLTVFFDNVGVTTNAYLLDDRIIDELKSINLRYIQFSLCYWNPEKYKKEIGLDQSVSKEHIVRFLSSRNENTRAFIHIFDNSNNSNEERKEFFSFFKVLIKPTDVTFLYEYIEFLKNDIHSNYSHRIDIKPCYQMWQVLMIDEEGFAWPCCMGVWKKHDSYLCIGNIHENLASIAKKLVSLRRKQLCEGDYATCRNCETIRHNKAFRLPLFLYNSEKSLRDKISERALIKPIISCYRGGSKIIREVMRGGVIKRCLIHLRK